MQWGRWGVLRLSAAFAAMGPHTAAGQPSDTQPPGASVLSVQLTGGAGGIAHFPDTNWERSIEEAVDGVYGVGAFLGSRRAAMGLSFERVGMGKDHFTNRATGDTSNAVYGADVLSLSGRWYFAPSRPAFFVQVDIGAALPTVRASGTRAGAVPFVSPPTAFECTSFGREGAGMALTAGVELDIATAWAFMGAARAHGLLLSRSSDSFDECAPGTGPAVGGALQVGFAYRWDLSR